jgi:hypothetical protein
LTIAITYIVVKEMDNKETKESNIVEKEEKKNEEPKEEEKPKIEAITVGLPYEADFGFAYDEKHYEGDGVPKVLIELIDSLTLSDVVIPEGIGLDGTVWMDVTKEGVVISYIVTGDNKLCITKTRACYNTTKDIEQILNVIKG